MEITEKGLESSWDTGLSSVTWFTKQRTKIRHWRIQNARRLFSSFFKREREK